MTGPENSTTPVGATGAGAYSNVAATGLEHVAEMPGKQGIPAERGTESGTVGDDSAGKPEPMDPELAAVVKAWAHLPEPIKAGILAMVKAAKG